MTQPKTDLVLCSIPRMSIYYPPAAPALLKACVEAQGYQCRTVDFVIEFHNKFFNHALWDRIDNWMVIPDFCDLDAYELIRREVNQWATQLAEMRPRWVGISVFSYESHKISKLLCLCLRRIDPSIKIVLGGMGVTDDFHQFGPTMKSLSLCDAFITGDGEDAIIDLLRNDAKKKFYRIEKLDQYPFAAWEDYDLDRYKASKKRQNEAKKESAKDIWQGYGNAWYRSDEILTLPIVGSRGCVRKCSFCDIPNLWPKYQTRSAQNIADEIIKNYEEFGVQRFHFTDSLINGNMKNFRQLCNILARYRDDQQADYTCTGQFIVRSHASETDHDYDMISRAGFKILEVGIESGSEAVRFHMGKKFTDQDIDVFMHRISKYDIMTVFLLIVGYPTETQKDFEATLQMLTRYQNYLHNGTIIEACLGGTLRIEPNTGLANDPHVRFERDTQGNIDDLNWTYTINPDLSLQERIRRRLVLMDHATKLGYMSPTNHQEMTYLQAKVKQITGESFDYENNDILQNLQTT